MARSRKDRVLVKPAAHHSLVKLPEEGTLAAYLIDALWHGCRIDSLETETGWSKPTLLVNLSKVARKTGVGIRRKADTLHLILPQGSGDIHPRKKVAGKGGNIRSMAAEVVIIETDL